MVYVEAGMPRIASRIFALLVSTDSGRLTAAEISERLLASPAAVSGGVRYLIQVDLISREREPGSRRDHYRAADDVWYQAIAGRDQLLGKWTTQLRDGVDVLGAETAAGRRMAESVEFFEFMQKELHGMLDRWREHRAQQRQRA